MADFTKTIIVDPNNPDPDFRTIKQGVTALGSSGGVVIAEQGTYTINSSNNTVSVPSNVTIIGRGNAVIQVTNKSISAFKNADESNERIRPA